MTAVALFFSFAIAAMLVGALAILAQRTSISIIVRKDPDMATILQRLATAETALADLKTLITSVQTTVNDLAGKPDLSGSINALSGTVDGFGQRLDAIQAEIGTDPAAAGQEQQRLEGTQDAAAAPVTAAVVTGEPMGLTQDQQVS